MFKIFKKIKKSTKAKIQIDPNESLAFRDLLRQSIKITREISGNEILIGVNIDKSKIILDKELCLLLISILKEYCLTDDILNSFEMLRERED